MTRVPLSSLTTLGAPLPSSTSSVLLPSLHGPRSSHWPCSHLAVTHRQTFFLCMFPGFLSPALHPQLDTNALDAEENQQRSITWRPVEGHSGFHAGHRKHCGRSHRRQCPPRNSVARKMLWEKVWWDSRRNSKGRNTHRPVFTFLQDHHPNYQVEGHTSLNLGNWAARVQRALPWEPREQPREQPQEQPRESKHEHCVCRRQTKIPEAAQAREDGLRSNPNHKTSRTQWQKDLKSVILVL